MAKEKKSKKDDKKLYAYYVELESPLDLARSTFDSAAGHIKAVKDQKKYRLVSTGEKLGDIRMIYYTTVDTLGNYFVYSPGTYESFEKFDINNSAMETDYKSYRAPIVELITNPYTEVKDFKKGGKIVKIEIKDANALIKALASYAREEESVPKVYAFYDGKDHIIGTFEFFRESGARIFAYAKISFKEKFGTLRFNYMYDSIEPANSFTEKSAVYIRVINLKKQLPFF
jgi:hypothetical protein